MVVVAVYVAADLTLLPHRSRRRRDRVREAHLRRIASPPPPPPPPPHPLPGPRARSAWVQSPGCRNPLDLTNQPPPRPRYPSDPPRSSAAWYRGEYLRGGLSAVLSTYNTPHTHTPRFHSVLVHKAALRGGAAQAVASVHSHHTGHHNVKQSSLFRRRVVLYVHLSPCHLSACYTTARVKRSDIIKASHFQAKKCDDINLRV